MKLSISQQFRLNYQITALYFEVLISIPYIHQYPILFVNKPFMSLHSTQTTLLILYSAFSTKSSYFIYLFSYIFFLEKISYDVIIYLILSIKYYFKTRGTIWMK